jgi:hypothetical protein
VDAVDGVHSAVLILLDAIYGLFIQQLQHNAGSSKKVNSNKHGRPLKHVSAFKQTGSASCALGI